MSRPIHVHLLPSLFEPESLEGGVAVVIDVLRASTTMTVALQNGASCVIPCGSTDDANAAFHASPETVLRGGERGGVKIDGFELSNSPDDYSTDVVRGKTIAFTTTNGTKAMLRCHSAGRVLVGSFVNFSAITGELARCSNPIHLVCAGTDGHVTGEDVLFAGVVVQRLTGCMEVRGVDETKWTLSDSALLALCGWLQMAPELTLPGAMQKTQGARNLRRLGYDRDILTAGTIDLCDVIGEFNSDTGRVEACVCDQHSG